MSRHQQKSFVLTVKFGCIKGGDEEVIEYLIKYGFIVRQLFGDWYLVRLYADRSNPLHHIIFPTRLVDKKNKCETFTLTKEQRTALHERYKH